MGSWVRARAVKALVDYRISRVLGKAPTMGARLCNGYLMIRSGKNANAGSGVVRISR